MSFSNDVKNELYSILEEKECCKKAFLFGVFSFSRKLFSSNIIVKCKKRNLATKLAEYISNVFQIIVDIVPAVHRNIEYFCVCVANKSDKSKILKFFYVNSNLDFLEKYRQNITKDCCLTAFLRAVFLVCGSIKNPSKGYQLEFHMGSLEKAKAFVRILNEIKNISIFPSVYEHNGNFCVYIKKSEHIADFLVYIGANLSAMDLIQVKMLKEIRSNANRTTNFETANIGRTAASSVEQLNAIKKISKYKGLDSLPPDLKYSAILRVNNPELSLTELTKLSSKNISKSTLSRHLSKIVKIAKNM